jgi:hypothetical protein
MMTDCFIDITESVFTKGVYLLTYGGIAVYCGQSSSVVCRVNAHFKAGEKLFDGVKYLSVDDMARGVTEVEAECILMLGPKYNWKNGRLIVPSASKGHKEKMAAKYGHMYREGEIKWVSGGVRTSKNRQEPAKIIVNRWLLEA